MHKTTLTTYEIAEICQVTPRTVIQWINDGKLKAFRTPGNHSRVNKDDLVIFLKKYNMPYPQELVTISHEKKRILIVDDDPGMVDAIKRCLIQERIYDITVAYNGFEAGQKFADHKPDLIVLDIQMPGIDGYKVCSSIRQHQANSLVKILFISGTIKDQDMGKIKLAGADDFLAKPFTNSELRVRVEQLLTKGVSV